MVENRAVASGVEVAALHGVKTVTTSARPRGLPLLE